ncbi:MAG: hypothetical protein QOC70_734 [Verrucomicrobiota bacterium]|jgi:PAS domain S-box-containing protein
MTSAVMMCHHDQRLVVLSIVISMMAAFAARELVERINEARGSAWLAWLAGASAVDGMGTWSMHYTGKLACHLPVHLLFDWRMVLLSLLVGISGTAATLLVLTRHKFGWGRALVGSILLGGWGVSALHYVSMAAIVEPVPQYASMPLAIAAVVLAMAISFGAIILAFRFPVEVSGSRWRKHASSILRGTANPVMHYTAMAGVTFGLGQAPDLSRAIGIWSIGVAGISIAPLMVLVVGLLTSLVDRLNKQRILLNELFEQAPQAVALLSDDSKIVRVNREFSRLFGYSAVEAIGRSLRELIIPPEFIDEHERYLAAWKSGERMDSEVVRQRKDKSRLHVSALAVPVSLPGGKIAGYAIYRDITSRRKAEEELKNSYAQLRALSRRLEEAHESERRHLARELHDQIGQALTAAKINTEILRSAVPSDLSPRLDETATILDRLLQQTRQISLDLRPPLLDDLGLGPALRWYVNQQAERAGLQARFSTDPLADNVPPYIQTACFRLAQEAITNVVRHAHATILTVEIRCDEAFLRLVVRDNGAGFDVAEAQARAEQGASLGLLGIKERAALAGGSARIISSAQGTTIEVILPSTASTSGLGQSG